MDIAPSVSTPTTMASAVLSASAGALQGYRPTPPYRAAAGISPLVLADRLITLAQDADRAGYRDTASLLVTLTFSMLDDTAHKRA
jgi:hypothetical protein